MCVYYAFPVLCWRKYFNSCDLFISASEPPESILQSVWPINAKRRKHFRKCKRKFSTNPSSDGVVSHKILQFLFICLLPVIHFFRSSFAIILIIILCVLQVRRNGLLCAAHLRAAKNCMREMTSEKRRMEICVHRLSSWQAFSASPQSSKQSECTSVPHTYTHHITC